MSQIDTTTPSTQFTTTIHETNEVIDQESIIKEEVSWHVKSKALMNKLSKIINVEKFEFYFSYVTITSVQEWETSRLEISGGGGKISGGGGYINEYGGRIASVKGKIDPIKSNTITEKHVKIWYLCSDGVERSYELVNERLDVRAGHTCLLVDLKNLRNNRYQLFGILNFNMRQYRSFNFAYRFLNPWSLKWLFFADLVTLFALALYLPSLFIVGLIGTGCHFLYKSYKRRSRVKLVNKSFCSAMDEFLKLGLPNY